jgi:hypothetical protein
MAKKTYKARWTEFVEAVKAAGKVTIFETISGKDLVVTIKKETLMNLIEAVADFVKIKEFPDSLKPYRNSKHYVSYAANTNSYGHLNIEFEEAEPEIVLTEDMVSNHRSFNDCGEFTLTLDGVTYSVKYQTSTKEIKTDAPDHIKQALIAWWFI